MAKQMEALTQVFQHVLRSAAERAAERRERTNTEDFDEEELEALQVWHSFYIYTASAVSSLRFRPVVFETGCERQCRIHREDLPS
jgi:hypothetical protein